MRRRQFLSTSAIAFAGWPLAGAAVAQDPQDRPGWSPSGPLQGREPEDPGQLSAEERRHVPVLVMPRQVRRGRPFDLVVQVGVDPHVMVGAHHVDWIEVAIDERRVFVADLSPAVAYPVVRVPIVMEQGATLTARAHCNLHGVWRTRRQVEVA